MKEFVREFLAGVNEGMFDAFRLFWALMLAPIEVLKEFVTYTGRFAPKREDGHTRSD
jgi:hypothetical protein